MKTEHNIFYKNANDIKEISDESVDLLVTSPPYPMIEMWDNIFAIEDPTIIENLTSGKGKAVFEKMNKILDQIWLEVDRVLKYGGIICINIGDATRSLNKSFSLYPSHARIINFFYDKDYYMLPEILWRKQVNSPTKYMGSGMLPVGAYVTLEHEYIIIMRKGKSKREFKKEDEKLNRQRSSFFWEERNLWFSDIWFDIKGEKQILNNEDLRDRSAAYPFEIPYRLINMFSVKGDTVIDPFLGTGTTTLAAMLSCRNSVGIEVVKEFEPSINNRILNTLIDYNKVIFNRLNSHEEFIKKELSKGKEFKYLNKFYNFPVKSSQEVNLYLNTIKDVSILEKGKFCVEYE